MEVPLVSATQVQLWIDCKRKWGFKYLERIEVPKHPGALLGTDVQDNQIDPYLLTGRRFDFTRPSGEIANALVPLLPRPMTPGMRLRRKFVFPSPTGRFAYQGEFDLWAPDSACVPGLVGGRPLLGDIKTTSNLAYAKTEETLATDIQHNLYSTVMLIEDGVDEHDSVWFYARTRKPHRVQRVHLHVRAAETVERFQQIDENADRLAATRLANPKVGELEPNARMCDAYGGCPFRNRCNLSPVVHAAAVNLEAVVEKTNDFLASLRKATVPAPIAGVPAPTFTVHAAGAEATHQPGVHPQPPLPPWLSAKTDPYHAQAAERAAAGGAGGATLAALAAPINPPESALPPAPPEAPKARRGRPPKEENHPTVDASARVGVRLEDLEWLAEHMRACRVLRVILNADGALLEVYL